MKILLAVSGGVDSMYLACKAGELFPGAEPGIVHCNFSLRGAESDGDEEFVRAFAQKNRIPFFCRRFDTRGYAAENGISIEMAARDLRYAWFAELCAEQGYDAVAVAHNANDNAETLLLNLLRGTGSKGLRGMSAESTVKCAGRALKIIRPLLSLSREDIVKGMKALGQSWREDSTNALSDVKRNKLRNLVFPVFSEINPSFVRTLGRDIAHFRQADDIAEDYFRSAGLDIEAGVDLRKLLALKHWKYVLFRLLEPYNFSEETFGKLTELLESGRTVSGKLFQSPTHVASIKLKTLSVRVKGLGH